MRAHTMNAATVQRARADRDTATVVYEGAQFRDWITCALYLVYDTRATYNTHPFF